MQFELTDELTGCGWYFDLNRSCHGVNLPFLHMSTVLVGFELGMSPNTSSMFWKLYWKGFILRRMAVHHLEPTLLSLSAVPKRNGRLAASSRRPVGLYRRDSFTVCLLSYVGSSDPKYQYVLSDDSWLPPTD